MNMNAWLKYSLCLLWACATTVHALSSDQEQVLNANSDSAEINQQTGINVYIGHVHAVQGTTKLQADKVVTKSDTKHQLIEVIAYGNPAVYKTIPEEGKAELTATALEIHFFPPQHYVQLMHNAVVVQDGNRFAAPLINYDTESKTVTSPANSTGRTSILLQPSTFKKKP